MESLLYIGYTIYLKNYIYRLIESSLKEIMLAKVSILSQTRLVCISHLFDSVVLKGSLLYLQNFYLTIVDIYSRLNFGIHLSDY